MTDSNRIQSMPDLSIRAASWLGAQCVWHFCQEHSITDSHLDTFCCHIEALATATDLPAWEELGTTLEVTGLGDPLPGDLSKVDGLAALVDSVREISASQMYGSYDKQQVARFLNEAIRLSGMHLHRHLIEMLVAHKYGADGWGKPVSVETLAEWEAHNENEDLGFGEQVMARGCFGCISLPLLAFFGGILWFAIQEPVRQGWGNQIGRFVMLDVLIAFLLVPLFGLARAILPDSLFKKIEHHAARAGKKLMWVIILTGTWIFLSLLVFSIIQLIRMI